MSDARPSSITLTLHPALDRLLDAERIEVGGLFDVRVRAVVPAGKGINTARVLRRLTRGRVAAAAWVGADDAAFYRRALLREGIAAELCLRPCATRWGVTILEAGGRETHFKETMPAPSKKETASLLRFLAGLHGDTLALCGSAPPGTPKSLLRHILRTLRERFKHLVVDSSGPLLDEAGRVGCNGLKGNGAEIGEWLGLRGKWNPALRAHRTLLLKRLEGRPGQAPRAILITLGSRGAALATRESLCLARCPRVAASKIVSPTGCGDAATAGWLWALADHAGPEEAVRRAIACGTAKLLNADPGVVDPAEVRRFCTVECVAPAAL
jgi:1-phosphofructokinase family hexose kinase